MPARRPDVAGRPRSGPARGVGPAVSTGSGDVGGLLLGGLLPLVAVQGGLQLGLGVLGERRLEHRAAVLGHGLHRLVRRDLVDDQEEGRGAGLEHLTYLVLELLVDRTLGYLAHEGAEAGAD